MQQTIFGLQINISKRDSLFDVGDSKIMIFSQDYRVSAFDEGSADFGKAAYISKDGGDEFPTYKDYMSSIGKVDEYRASQAYKGGLHHCAGMFHRDEGAIVYSEVFKFIRGSVFLNILHGRWVEYGGLSENNHMLKVLRDFKVMAIKEEYNFNKLYRIDKKPPLVGIITPSQREYARFREPSFPLLDTGKVETILVKQTIFFSIISRSPGIAPFLYSEKLPFVGGLRYEGALVSITDKVDILSMVSNSGVTLTFQEIVVGFSQAFAIITINTLSETNSIESELELLLN